MKKKWLLVSLLWLLSLGATGAFGWERSFDAKAKNRLTSYDLYSWKNTLIGNGNVKGMSLDFDSEASFSSKTRMGGMVSLPITNNTNLQFGYNSFDHGGTINRGVKFDNQTYKNGASLRLQNRWLDLTGAYNLTKEQTSYWDFLYGLKVGEAQIDISGTDSVTGKSLSGSWDQKFPIPYIGLGGGIQLSDGLLIDGHLKFISVSLSGGTMRSYDMDITLAYRMNGMMQPAKTKSQGMFGTRKKTESTTDWYVITGYRKFSVDGSFDNDSVKLGYSGPLFGVMGRF